MAETTRAQFSKTEIENLCKPFFADIQENHFQVQLTRNGSPCIILSRACLGHYPIMGVYWTGDEWVAVKWDIDGCYISKNNPRGLDINIQESDEVA